ncbi:MAG: hypothetical protein MZV65_45040 [Chromatiales bacterium]|nr:hypothetical protein [Chromatiales bacterium]
MQIIVIFRVNTKKLMFISYCLAFWKPLKLRMNEMIQCRSMHDCFMRREYSEITADFTKDIFAVQDIAAQPICALALPLRGSLLDVGSAPGGAKSRIFLMKILLRYPLYALDSSILVVFAGYMKIFIDLALMMSLLIESDYLSYKPDTLFTHIFIDAPCSGIRCLFTARLILNIVFKRKIFGTRRDQRAVGMLIHAAGCLAPDGETTRSTHTQQA